MDQDGEQNKPEHSPGSLTAGEDEQLGAEEGGQGNAVTSLALPIGGFIPSSANITQDVPFKESAAKEIAEGVVKVFKFSVLGTLVGGFVVIVGCLYWDGTLLPGLFKDAVVPFLQSVGTFATTVFGPLLAFILGYYFGEKGKNSASK